MRKSSGTVPGSKRKAWFRAGFSISELLFCVMIMLLATGIIVPTLSLGIRQFEARVRDSEAQILCNTLSLAVQDQLACVKEIRSRGAEGQLETFTSGAYSGMENVPCRFVYQMDDGTYSESGGGVVAMQLGADDYYPLVSRADYNQSTPLAAEVSVTCETEWFLVTVTVSNASGGSQSVSNTFTVTPVSPGVLS